MSYCLYKWLMPEMLCLESPYSLAKEIASLKVPLMNKSRALFPNLDNTSEFLSCCSIRLNNSWNSIKNNLTKNEKLKVFSLKKLMNENLIGQQKWTEDVVALLLRSLFRLPKFLSTSCFLASSICMIVEK